MKQLTKYFFFFLILSSCDKEDVNINQIIFDYRIDNFKDGKGFGTYLIFNKRQLIKSENIKNYYWYNFEDDLDTNVFLYTKDTIIPGCLVIDTKCNCNEVLLFLSPYKLVSLQLIKDEYEFLFLSDFNIIIKKTEEDSLVFNSSDEIEIIYMLDKEMINKNDSIKMNKEFTFPSFPP